MAGRGSEQERRSNRRRRWTRGLLIAAIGALLFEAGLHAILGNFAQSHLLQRADDPDVCLELRPGADIEYTGWLLRVPPTRMRVNSLGGRGAEVPDKTPGRLRIATFGDSFTFGQGVEEDESWPAAMGAALGERGVDVEVLNFGVPGHGTPQSVAHALRVAPRVDPDVVLVGVFTNDLSPQDSYCGYGGGDSTLGRFLLQRVYTTRLLWVLTGPLRGGPPVPEGAAPPAERFLDALERLHARGTTDGYRTAAVLLSDRSAYAAQPWCDGCTPPHDLLADHDVAVVDVSSAWPVLVDHEDRYFIRGEEHLTAAGNRILGRAVAEAMVEVLALGPAPPP